MNRNNIAWALVRLGRNLDEAQKLADAAVLAEHSAAYLGTRCWVFAARGELDRARADCEAAVKLADDDVLDRGMLRFVQGDRPGALAIWEQAAKDDPAHAHDLVPWLELARKAPDSPAVVVPEAAAGADAG